MIDYSSEIKKIKLHNWCKENGYNIEEDDNYYKCIKVVDDIFLELVLSSEDLDNNIVNLKYHLKCHNIYNEKKLNDINLSWKNVKNDFENLKKTLEEKVEFKESDQLWILSQDKKELILANHIELSGTSQTYIKANEISVGSYKNQDDALKVLIMINDHINKYKNMVFAMPQDDEVESLCILSLKIKK